MRFAVLGLSTALLLLYLVSERMSILRQVIVLIGFLLVGGKSAMTFSRSGLYAAAASIAPALFFLALDSRTRARVGRVMAVVVVVFGRICDSPSCPHRPAERSRSVSPTRA